MAPPPVKTTFCNVLITWAPTGSRASRVMPAAMEMAWASRARATVSASLSSVSPPAVRLTSTTLGGEASSAQRNSTL